MKVSTKAAGAQRRHTRAPGATYLDQYLQLSLDSFPHISLTKFPGEHARVGAG